VRLAYGVRAQSQITGNPDWTSWDRYQIEIASTSPMTTTQMQQVLLRKVLDQCFALRVREVDKPVPGYAIVVAPGGIKFPAVSKKPPFSISEGTEILSGLPQLASVLSQYYYDGKLFGVTRPVRDATGLRGYFRIPFPVAPEYGENLLSMLGGLGLRVISSPGVELQLQVLHIDHLRTGCYLGPESALPKGKNVVR